MFFVHFPVYLERDLHPKFYPLSCYNTSPGSEGGKRQANGKRIELFSYGRMVMIKKGEMGMQGLKNVMMVAGFVALVTGEQDFRRGLVQVMGTIHMGLRRIRDWGMVVVMMKRWGIMAGFRLWP